MQETNVYRVAYVYRAKPPNYKDSTQNSAVVEKIANVVAATDADAVAFINSIKGNEVVHATMQLRNVLVASAIAKTQFGGPEPHHVPGTHSPVAPPPPPPPVRR